MAIPFTPTTSSNTPVQNTPAPKSNSGAIPFIPGSSNTTNSEPKKKGFLSSLFGFGNKTPEQEQETKRKLQDTGTGIAKSIGSSAIGTGQLTTRLFGKIPGKFGEPARQQEQKYESMQSGPLAAKNPDEATGKTIGEIAQFFIPAGEVNTAEKFVTGAIEKGIPSKIVQKVATIASKSAIRSAESSGITALQTGGEKEKTKTAAVAGAAIPLVPPVLRKTADILGGAAKRFAGAVTGRGTAVIESILKDPKAALEGLNGQSIDVGNMDVNKIKQGVVNIRTQANQEYSRVLGTIQDMFEHSGESFDKPTEVRKVADVLGGRGIELNDDGTLNFEKTNLDPKKDNVVQKAFNLVKNYSGTFTPKSMDTLAARLGNLKSTSGTTPETDTIVQNMINAIRGSVTDMAEKLGYNEGATMSMKYAQAMDKLDFFKKTLGIMTKPFTTDIEQERSRRVLGAIFTGGNKEGVHKAIASLGLPDVVSREAGRVLANATDRPSGNIGNKFWSSLIDPAIAPKMIGKITAWSGLAAEKVPEFLQKLSSMEPAVQGSIIQLINGDDK